MKIISHSCTKLEIVYFFNHLVQNFQNEAKTRYKTLY